MIRYCFHKDCYVGIMVFHENGEIEMRWEPDENLDEDARNYKKYMGLKTTEEIKIFIEERTIDERRPDRGVWLGMIGLNCSASRMEIFLKGRGVSINDYFWFDEVKSTAWWDNGIGAYLKEEENNVR